MGRLRARPPHVFSVQRRKTIRDERGNRVMVDDGPPVIVRGKGEPARDWSQAEENLYNGLQMIDLLVVYALTWPGDVNSIVTTDGRVFETVGAPQHFNVSPRTEHWRITLKWVKDEEDTDG